MEAFFRAARRARGRASQATGGGLTLAQFQLVDVLRDGEPRPVGQLAEAGGVAQPTATRMLETLERAGAVERVPHPSDRRCVLVSLTPAGREAADAKGAEVQAAREQISSSLAAQERREAAVLLRRLAALMEDL